MGLGSDGLVVDSSLLLISLLTQQELTVLWALFSPLESEQQCLHHRGVPPLH